jgi:hypothetical protein
MTAQELSKLSKQMGNRIVEARGGKLYGYEVVTYKNYEPDTIKLVNVIDNSVNKVVSWDTAHDLLFGTPTAPDFSRVLA